MTIEKNKSARKEVRILLAHGTRLMREGMAGLLNEAGFELVADINSEADLARLTTGYNPDILLLDWDLPST